MSKPLARLVFAALSALVLGSVSVAQSGGGSISVPSQGWGAEWEALDGRNDWDSQIVILQQPKLTNGNREIRASWAVGWVDRNTSTSRGPGRSGELRLGPTREEDRDSDKVVPSVFSFPLLFEDTTLEFARELYLEGPVEFFEDGKRIAYADAIYLDRVDGHGWIAGANYSFRERIGGSSYVLKVQADWLRISADGSLSSKRAKVTTSEFDVPSYYITTGDLRLDPTGDTDYPYEVRLRKNGIRIRDTVTLPLPPIDYFANEDGEPSLGGIQVGNDARFGSVIGLEYSRDLDESLGDKVNRWLGGDPENFRSRVRFDVSFLGSRGLLLDPGLRLRSPGRYRWDTDFAIIPDSGEDRGLVRVPEDDRSSLRTWVRSRGRFIRGPEEWIDVRLTRQSDAGVQAEFFEREFLQFEERQSWVHWRKASGADYYSASVVTNLDNFRSEVEELPEIEQVHLRQPIAGGKNWTLLHGYESDLGYYRREEGLLPFEGPFADGFGEVDSLRLAHQQTLESPLELGFAGARLVPFANLDWVGYSQDGLEEDEVSQLTGIAGVRLATTFWRSSANGGSTEISPSLGWREDVFFNQDDVPAAFDELETRQLEGEITDLRLRARWDLPAWLLKLDGEVNASYLGRSETAIENEWLPLSVFASASTKIGSVPIAITHNGVYSTTSESTEFANTLLDIRPTEKLDLQFSFGTGRNLAGFQTFEAATFAALYRFTPKWDIEGRHTIDLNNSQEALNTAFTIKRYGHDLLFELRIRDRTGEGVSVGIGIKPLLSARKRPRSRLSLFSDN